MSTDSGTSKSADNAGKRHETSCGRRRGAAQPGRGDPVAREGAGVHEPGALR
ncbi:MAG TPA: hypothetical protein VFF30_08240 [Nitrososphaerales archaeon]|nr:hypothetical protein [Nitrososphaerales archaeon]